MEIHGWNRGFHRICIYKWIDWIDFQLATFDHWRVPIGDLPRWRRWYVTNDDVQIWISYSDNTLPNKPNEFWENRINKTSFDINSTDTWSVVDFFRCVLEFGSQDSTISRLVAHVFFVPSNFEKTNFKSGLIGEPHVQTWVAIVGWLGRNEDCKIFTWHNTSNHQPWGWFVGGFPNKTWLPKAPIISVTSVHVFGHSWRRDAQM